MPDEQPTTDSGWVAAWDQLDERQRRLSRELLLTWIMVGCVVAGLVLYAAGAGSLAKVGPS